MRASPERTAAIAAGESFYFTGKACCKGHLAKRSVVGSRCATCASQATMRCQAKRPDHPARIAARERGERYYSTGQPCKHGHDKRWVSNGVCVECGVKWSREWDAKNLARNARKTRERRAKDPTSHRAASKRWKQNNKQKALENDRKWRAANIVAWRAYQNAYVQNRRARKAQNGGSYTPDDIQRLRAQQNGCCAACRLSGVKLQVDHVVPVVKGGSNDPSNLQLLCAPCNKSKGARNFEEWMTERGYQTTRPSVFSN